MEIERYENISEDVETLTQRCEEALRQQEEVIRQEIDSIREAHHQKQLQTNEIISKLQKTIAENQKKSDMEQEQQEIEYEDEIRELKMKSKIAIEKEWQEQAKKEAEMMEQKNKLKNKKKIINDLKDLLSNQATTNVRLKKNKENLEALLEHREHTIEEIQASLNIKESEILHLRANNRKLDNFRYVLDNKINKLTEERGPVSEHISKLESHIKEMYDELVKEFQGKKHVYRIMKSKDLKVESLASEVTKLRTMNRQKERLNTAVLHVIDNAVKLTNAKDCQEAVKNMYRTFVKREGIEEAITNNQKPGNLDSATLKEALRQRTHMVKTAGTLKRALKLTKEKLQEQKKRSISQNAILINECNSLRKENKLIKIHLHEVESENKLLEINRQKMSKQNASSKIQRRKSSPNLNLNSNSNSNSNSKRKNTKNNGMNNGRSSLTPFQKRQQKRGSRDSLSSMGGIRGKTFSNEEDQRVIELQKLEIRRLRDQIEVLVKQIPNFNGAKAIQKSYNIKGQ
eukprot:GSMAST32.ASY1.ANO1.1060.1 assembled CDS